MGSEMCIRDSLEPPLVSYGDVTSDEHMAADVERDSEMMESVGV